MSLHQIIASLREPISSARWLLIVFAATTVAAMNLVFGGMDLLDLILFPWVAGPTALAALLACLVRSKVEAWLLIGVEAIMASSTLWLFVDLWLRTGPESVQASLALFILPVYQFAALASFAAAIVGTALIVRDVRAAKPARHPIGAQTPRAPL